MSVFRIYVEKKPEYAVEAKAVLRLPDVCQHSIF